VRSKVGGEDDQSQWFGGRPMSARALEGWIVPSSSWFSVLDGFILGPGWRLPLCRTAGQLDSLLAL